MVNAFASTEWVAGSGGAVISRSVSSCAGMTAYLVLLAQTRVGFLSGGRGKSFHQLTPQEQAAQKEEAFARATVALTRAQQICLIMGPLDMRGLVGAATIMGCLKYGACFSGLDDQDDPVLFFRLKDEDLLEAPDDSAFLQSLRFSCARINGVYPPLALVEAFITEDDSAPRVRRLHLIVVDLNRRRRLAARVKRQLSKIQVDRCAAECWNTLPIPWKQNQEAYQLRYVFGYAMDGSDLPCYILWPIRTAEQSFWCMDAWKGDWVQLDKCGFIAPVGIEHFFDAFCFNPQRPWRAAPCQALGIPSCQVAEDTHLEHLHENKFMLTPRRIPAERKATADKSRVDLDMDAPGVQLLNGQEKLQEVMHVPRTWPLVRLTIPLAGLSKQIDRLLEGYCFQILATNRDPEAHNGKVIQTATHLTWILAEYLAVTIAWLMRSILDHASKILFDNDTQPLLTPSFWILPLYRELLNSARRIRPSAASERARGCTGLVKLICKENKEQRGKRKFHAGTPHPNDGGGFTQWFGSCSLISTLYVWFPASWAPMVPERLFGWSSYPQRGQPASGTPEHILGTNIVMVLLVPVGQWRTLTALKWCTKSDNAHCQGARGERLTVAIMLPGRQDADDWLNFMLSQKNLWPTFTTRGTFTEEVSEQVFLKERRRLQTKHLWMEVKLRWRVLADRMYTVAPTGKSKEELDALLFDRAARRSHTNPYEEKAYRGPALKEVQAWWSQCKEWMSYYKGQSRWSLTSRAF
eukprot:symbB.v1.2.031227.t2/scaffold3601.1/size53442/2